MTKFRPCIDLHHGKVKQIVGGTLRDGDAGPQVNYVSDHDAAWYARKYRDDALHGGHVICLGPGNEEAARSALAAWPSGLQIGGGIHAANAAAWVEAGASHVIVTSALFDENGNFLPAQLDALIAAVGREKLVIDLSCRRTATGWSVAMNRWQTITSLEVNATTLDHLADHCAEFLIHAADVEGLCAGIDGGLVELLGTWGRIPLTYAGGVACMADVEKVRHLSHGKVDVTVGSALDLFGGKGVRYQDLLAWNRGS
jgi:phosphoribosylformimino-5-aminoimidazole carboxamide ribotide isomerase